MRLMAPLHPAEREVLKKVSPELDLKILSDTKKGLDAVVNLLDSLPQLFFWFVNPPSLLSVVFKRRGLIETWNLNQ